jgi:hypothetical protein
LLSELSVDDLVMLGAIPKLRHGRTNAPDLLKERSATGSARLSTLKCQW